nr:MAG TPA: hypothetical protein [Caudoviricetes sp.]DAU49179.1 MAG TPA: hypothetical protein [Caudoviricetes sp.]
MSNPFGFIQHFQFQLNYSKMLVTFICTSIR